MAVFLNKPAWAEKIISFYDIFKLRCLSNIRTPAYRAARHNNEDLFKKLCHNDDRLLLLTLEQLHEDGFNDLFEKYFTPDVKLKALRNKSPFQAGDVPVDLIMPYSLANKGDEALASYENRFVQLTDCALSGLEKFNLHKIKDISPLLVSLSLNLESSGKQAVDLINDAIARKTTQLGAIPSEQKHLISRKHLFQRQLSLFKPVEHKNENPLLNYLEYITIEQPKISHIGNLNDTLRTPLLDSKEDDDSAPRRQSRCPACVIL